MISAPFNNTPFNFAVSVLQRKSGPLPGVNPSLQNFYIGEALLNNFFSLTG